MEQLIIENIQSTKGDTSLMEGWVVYHTINYGHAYLLCVENKSSHIGDKYGIEISRTPNKRGKYGIKLVHTDWNNVIHTIEGITIGDFKHKSALFKLFEIHIDSHIKK